MCDRVFRSLVRKDQEMGVILAGCGGGNEDGLTLRAAEAIKKADLVIGSKRILDGLKGYIKSDTAEAVSCAEQLSLIKKKLSEVPSALIAVLFSGDTGIFSGAENLGKALFCEEIDFEVIPGVSSFAMMAAAMKRSYKGALLLSAHGREVDIIKEVSGGRDMYVLTDEKNSPNELCKLLSEAGLSSLNACVGEKLGYVNQNMTFGKVSEISKGFFEGPAVLFVEGVGKHPVRVCGIPDEEFIRGDVPMTKQMIRAAVLSVLAPREGDVCWDIGAGTGSVSVELAGFSETVYAVEKNPEAVLLIKKNREKFGAWNIRVVEGSAPECTDELKSPDLIFVGGSDGKLREIIGRVMKINPEAGVVITAVTLETLNLAVSVLEDYGREPRVVQIGVSRSVKRGNSSLMKAENPVFIISSGRLGA